MRISVESGSTKSDSTVNIASKYRKILTAIKLIDPSANINTNDDTVIHHPKEFLMGVDCTTEFKIINDLKTRFQRYFVYHVIESTRTVSSMNHGNDNIITTLQKNKTWLSQDKLPTHHEASINFIKYIITAFTFQQVAKERVVNALLNLELNKEEIFVLSIIPQNDTITTNSSSKKRSTDG